MPELIATVTDDAHTKTYKVRKVGKDLSTSEVSIPASFIEREAKKAHMPVDDFIDQYRAEWLYDNFGGAFMRFVPAKA